MDKTVVEDVAKRARSNARALDNAAGQFAQLEIQFPELKELRFSEMCNLMAETFLDLALVIESFPSSGSTRS